MRPDIPAFAIFSLLQRERTYRPPKMVRIMDGEKVLGYRFVDERDDFWDRFLSYFSTQEAGNVAKSTHLEMALGLQA